jgi:hypothetical protein
MITEDRAGAQAAARTAVLPAESESDSEPESIGQDSGRVLTRTIGEYSTGGDPGISHRLIIMDLY